jgi:hypothetical protein
VLLTIAHARTRRQEQKLLRGVSIAEQPIHKMQCQARHDDGLEKRPFRGPESYLNYSSRMGR